MKKTPKAPNIFALSFYSNVFVVLCSRFYHSLFENSVHWFRAAAHIWYAIPSVRAIYKNQMIIPANYESRTKNSRCVHHCVLWLRQWVLMCALHCGIMSVLVGVRIEVGFIFSLTDSLLLTIFSLCLAVCKHAIYFKSNHSPNTRAYFIHFFIRHFNCFCRAVDTRRWSSWIHFFIRFQLIHCFFPLSSLEIV